jgi:two-component system OmpR family response regulator
METQDELKVFIVDDDPLFCAAMQHYLEKEMPDIRLSAFPTGEACLHEMHQDPDIVLLDYRLDSEFEYAWDGLQIMKKIHGLDPGITVVFLSSQENVETAMNCVNEGALDYVVKNEQAFGKVKDIMLGIKDELIVEDNVEISAKNNIPQIIGLVILIVFVIVLLFRL